ncbi:hypothetical protein AgCh_028652 [Apium graveolens]
MATATSSDVLVTTISTSSVLEEEEERGVAHIVEHLAFSATNKYTNHDIIKFLESVGAEFGACQNAVTSYDETVYELFVPVDKPEVLPQAISILAEFSSEIWVSSDDLEKERGAVLKEYRGTRNANGRMQEAHWALMMEVALWKFAWAAPKELEGIPGNLGWPVVGESSSFLSEFSSPQGIYSFIKNRQKRYGKVFKSYVLGKYTIFMAGRDADKILLTGKDGLVTLNLFYTGKQVLGSTSLLQQSGEEHKRLRRLIAEPLSFDSLKKYIQFINTLAAETLDQWLDREFTLKVIGNMIMSLEPTGTEQDKFRTNFKSISSSFASLPLKLPGTAYDRGIKARDRMYAIFDSIISKRRSGKSVHQDFLESLIQKHTKNDLGEDQDDKLTDKQLKDNILTLLVAGHDTTTAALTWLIKFIAENPDVLERLRKEHTEILDNRKTGSSLTWSEVTNMPYTTKAPIKPFGYLGFGSGPRMCPGINLAKLELCIFVHHLVCRYKWTALEKDDSVQPTLVWMPKNKLPIKVEAL